MWNKVTFIMSDNEHDLLFLSLDQWNNIGNLGTGRQGGRVAVLQNKIFVSGGRSNSIHGVDMLNSVECYDPDTNTWSSLADMNIARYDHSLLGLQGKLYAFGGYNDAIEVYNTETDSWTIESEGVRGTESSLAITAFKYVLL